MATDVSPGRAVRWFVGMSGDGWIETSDFEEIEIYEWVLVLWYDPRPTQGRALGTAAVLRPTGRVEVVPRTWLP